MSDKQLVNKSQVKSTEEVSQPPSESESTISVTPGDSACFRFLYLFRKQNPVLPLRDAVEKGADVWEQLGCEDRKKFRKIKVKKSRRKVRNCRKARKRNARKPRSRCKKVVKIKSKGCLSSKRSKSKQSKRFKKTKRPKRVGGRKGKRKPVKRNRCVKKPKKRGRAAKRRKGAKGRRCMRGGPITNNGYLNFLRYYRTQKENCGKRAADVVKAGAKIWCSLPKKEKEKYKKLARKKSKQSINRGRTC